ncbi:MAG: DbpA RNA binding domain-containing protein [Treponema sp.]|nr:DbpA RNA binding domain-containing protein [Treponema sp.]
MLLNKEKARGNLKEVLDKMQSDTDAALLHEYYKIFKKEIPFFKRSFAAAWLFMYYDGKENPSMGLKTLAEKPVKQKKVNIDRLSASEELSEKSFLSEEESKRLFISIGKNRRLFPREVISMIMANTKTPREDIGIIRILDNYSFVQVRDSKADEIIEALNGLRFRGRTLTVNFAKPKTSDNENEQ